MFLSDTFSENTSSTLPILISFSSNLKTKRIRKIREFLEEHPDCQKYITKGPNFIADGINEFRLYYVDSSLYTDERTLKRLNIEKEEILFESSGKDSLETCNNLPRKREIYGSKNRTALGVNQSHFMKRKDKSTMCHQDFCNDSYSESTSKSLKIVDKVSKSFQVGPDLRFNVVYVNTDTVFHPLIHKTTVDAIMQTDVTQCLQANLYNQTLEKKYNDSSDCIYQFSRTSSIKFQIRKSPSFICAKNWKSVKPEKNKLTTFKDFCSKLDEKRGFHKYTDESEVNVESRTTSLKFSVKKSPSFVANYFLEILKNSSSHGDLITAEIIQRSIVNCVKCNGIGGGSRKNFKVAIRNDLITHPKMIRDRKEKRKYKDPCRKQKIAGIRAEPKTYKKRNTPQKKSTGYPIVQYRDINELDKLNRCNTKRNSTYRVKCLFKCANKDFFFKQSHYAILKKYYRKLKKNNNKNHHKHHHKKIADPTTELPLKNVWYKNHETCERRNRKCVVNHRDVLRTQKLCTGDASTRTTISGFLNSYRPWHWQDNSKLSVCVDEDCFTEETFDEENKIPPPWKPEMFRTKYKY
ncbi:hypothetical protein HHI36_005104 [Cryptolaemus montrouzieri]|uniref:Uncharacterized protein n=1 Tax=Cryptolaemus montrouzieri TaxID=559131 RepID=A0ABD2NTE2_9CUCU